MSEGFSVRTSHDTRVYRILDTYGMPYRVEAYDALDALTQWKVEYPKQAVARVEPWKKFVEGDNL